METKNHGFEQIVFKKALLGLDNTFDSITSLESQILGFDKHQVKPIMVKDNANKVAEQSGFKGIYNTSKDKLDSVMSKKYKLIQHTQAGLPLIDVLRNLGLNNVKGMTGCNGKRSYTLVWFEDSKTNVEVKKGDIIKLGLLVSNSVDGTLALWGQIIGLRLVCMNGMTTEGLIKSFRKIHLGSLESEEDVKEVTGNFYSNLILNISSYSEILKDIISRSIGEKLKQGVYELILSGINFPQRHIEKMLENLKGIDEMTKWDLYNQVTEYITHFIEKSSFERRLAFLKSANNILIMDADKLIELGRMNIQEREQAKIVNK